MMDRMTIRGDHGVFLEPHWDFCIDPKMINYYRAAEILDELAADMRVRNEVIE